MEHNESDGVATLIDMAKTVALQFYAAGCGITYAIQQACEYAREELRNRGHRNPASRIAMTATLAQQIALAAGLHPDQIRRSTQELMDAYRQSPHLTVLPPKDKDQEL